jgi:hypothetical protein
VTNHRGPELVGDDRELSNSIGLTGSTKGPRRSFETAHRGLGMLAGVALELSGARVSERLQRTMGEKDLGLLVGGGGVLIAAEGRRP